MTLKSKFKVENPVVFLFSVVYTIVGIVFLSIFVVYGLKPPHVGIIGVLSLITAYGVFRMEKWSVWLVIAIFFLGITFGATVLYDSVKLQKFEGALPFHIALIAYMIILLIAFIYVAAKREKFE